MKNGWSEERNAFVQFYGYAIMKGYSSSYYVAIANLFANVSSPLISSPHRSDTLDAANLMFPLVLFLAPNDPRMAATIAAIEAPIQEVSIDTVSLSFLYLSLSIYLLPIH